MHEKIPTKQTILKYGGILGLISITISTISYVIDGITVEPAAWEKYSSYILLISFIYLAIKAYKNLNSNYLKLEEAIKVGLGVALIAGLIAATYIFIFYNFIEPEGLDLIRELSEEKILDEKPEITEEQLEIVMSITNMLFKPTALVFITIISNLFFGLIIAIGIGAILKNEKPEFE